MRVGAQRATQVKLLCMTRSRAMVEREDWPETLSTCFLWRGPYKARIGAAEPLPLFVRSDFVFCNNFSLHSGR